MRKSCTLCDLCDRIPHLSVCNFDCFSVHINDEAFGKLGCTRQVQAVAKRLVRRAQNAQKRSGDSECVPTCICRDQKQTGIGLSSARHCTHRAGQRKGPRHNRPGPGKSRAGTRHSDKSASNPDPRRTKVTCTELVHVTCLLAQFAELLVDQVICGHSSSFAKLLAYLAELQSHNSDCRRVGMNGHVIHVDTFILFYSF